MPVSLTCSLCDSFTALSTSFIWYRAFLVHAVLPFSSVAPLSSVPAVLAAVSLAALVKTSAISSRSSLMKSSFCARSRSTPVSSSVVVWIATTLMDSCASAISCIALWAGRASWIHWRVLAKTISRKEKIKRV